MHAIVFGWKAAGPFSCEIRRSFQQDSDTIHCATCGLWHPVNHFNHFSTTRKVCEWFISALDIAAHRNFFSWASDLNETIRQLWQCCGLLFSVQRHCYIQIDKAVTFPFCKLPEFVIFRTLFFMSSQSAAWCVPEHLSCQRLTGGFSLQGIRGAVFWVLVYPLTATECEFLPELPELNFLFFNVLFHFPTSKHQHGFPFSLLLWR